MGNRRTRGGRLGPRRRWARGLVAYARARARAEGKIITRPVLPIVRAPRRIHPVPIYAPCWQEGTASKADSRIVATTSSRRARRTTFALPHRRCRRPEGRSVRYSRVLPIFDDYLKNRATGAHVCRLCLYEP